jgi:hypothetical protein
MDYLSNYYKNLCEQLQDKLNLLEAEIYGAEAKFMKALQGGSLRNVNPYIQGQKRKNETDALRAALADKSHPIHQNPEHVADVQRVLADIEKFDDKNPGLDIASDIAKHAVGEQPYEASLSTFGWAKDAPQYGYATAKHMRTAVDVMRGKYKPSPLETPTPEGGHVTPQQY